MSELPKPDQPHRHLGGGWLAGIIRRTRPKDTTRTSAAVNTKHRNWYSGSTMKRKRKKKTVEQRAASLVRFIAGTLGGKLGTFRCYLPAEPGPAREAVLRARQLVSNPPPAARD